MIRIPEHISAATPADESAVQATEADLGRPLMATIRSFYSLMNGAESDDGMVVYPVEVIAERQNTLALDSRMPFHQVVGSDGGDRVVLVAPTGEVILADTGNLRPGWGRPLAKDLLSWVRDGMSDGAVETPLRTVDVFLMRPPVDLASLVEIRRELKLDMSTADLLKASRATPARIATRLPEGSALPRCRRVSDRCLMLRDSDTGEEVPIQFIGPLLR